MKVSPALREKILEENVRVHAVEASNYEQLHPEIYNWYEQRATWRQIHLVDQLVTNRPTRRALDIGCGTGNILLKLSSLGFDVVGLDISRQMLDVLCKKGYPANRLICTDADGFLERYRDDKFDVIACSSVLHHLPNYLDTVSKALRLLSAGGVFLVTHEPERPIDHPQNDSPLKLWTIVQRLSWATYALRLRLCRLRLGEIDYTFSDFHAKDGIPVQDLINSLTSEGLEIIDVGHYVAEKTGWGALLNNRVFHRPPSNFSVIAQK